MKFFEQLLDLVISFSAKRAFSLIVVLGIAFGATWLIDSYTNYSRLYRLERITALVERVDALQRRGNPSKAIGEVTDSLIVELAALTAKEQAPSSRSLAIGVLLSAHWLKMICGGLPFFLFSLLAIPTKEKPDKNAWIGFWAMQSLTIAFALVNLAIPPFQTWWIDLILVPIGVTIVVGVIPLSIVAASAYRKVRQSSLQTAILNQLRMLSAAMDQFRLENGRDPRDLSEIVGPDKFVKSLSSIDGEQYESIDLRMGKALTVFRKSGDAVTYAQ